MLEHKTVIIQYQKDAQYILGAGALLRSDGLVLTVGHILYGAKNGKVKLYDGTEFAAKSLIIDPASDLGLCKINARNLPCFTLGNVAIGDPVSCIGHPMINGNLKFFTTFTGKVVSQNDLPKESCFIGNTKGIGVEIDGLGGQPGCCGGPLVKDGKLCGIFHQTSGKNPKISFFGSSNNIRTLLEVF